jgi:hypothetical protein
VLKKHHFLHCWWFFLILLDFLVMLRVSCCNQNELLRNYWSPFGQNESLVLLLQILSFKWKHFIKKLSKSDDQQKSIETSMKNFASKSLHWRWSHWQIFLRIIIRYLNTHLHFYFIEKKLYLNNQLIYLKCLQPNTFFSER